MSERLKTAAFVAGAVVLAAAAWLAQPERRTPAMFSDEGEAFYPEFRDPQAVRAIEVVDYDEPTATARPLKVEFRNSRWLISTNNDYPIDVGDRLVKTAAALMDLSKNQVRSDLAQDHARYGVVDPLDQKAGGLAGRGKRVTLRDAKKSVLADYILGKAVEGKAGWRYIRVPGGKRTYAVQTEADPSARFADWVNAGLLRMPSASIRRVTISGYSVDPLTGALGQSENLVLTQDSGKWGSSNGTVREEAARSLAATLDGLRIVDARPKPREMARDLEGGQMRLSVETALALRQFGFLLMQNGRVLGSEGELAVELANGVAYQVRFGEAAAGADRYLFVTTGWDAERAARYGDTSGAGERVSRDLNARFAGWFYVISNADFQKLRLTRAQVLR